MGPIAMKAGSLAVRTRMARAAACTEPVQGSSFIETSPSALSGWRVNSAPP